MQNLADIAQAAPIADSETHPGDGSLFLFQFGQGCYASPQYVWAYGRGLCDALENAAGWLADNAPGHFISEEDLTDYQIGTDDGYPVYADVTYTESGYLSSEDWTCDEIHDPEIADVVALRFWFREFDVDYSVLPLWQFAEQFGLDPADMRAWILRHGAWAVDRAWEALAAAEAFGRLFGSQALEGMIEAFGVGAVERMEDLNRDVGRVTYARIVADLDRAGGAA